MFLLCSSFSTRFGQARLPQKGQAFHACLPLPAPIP
jgi:hypothetical protein